MKRFYKDVAIDATPDGWRILLDGKPVQTPGRRTLLLPREDLAQGIAGEWRAQADEIVPPSMPMLRLANTVLDGVAQNRDAVIEAILRFGEHDALCYRVTYPADLVARQTQAWTPMLDWAASRHGVHLQVTNGLNDIEQPAEMLTRLREAVAAHDDFALAALHVMASITGSLVLALALAEGAINAAQAFQMSRLDEEHQAGQWGKDAEAGARAQALAREMDIAVNFLAASRA